MRKILSIVLTLGLVLGLMVAAAPALADVSAPVVTAAPTTVNDVAAYTVDFDITASLTGGLHYIKVEFPATTTVPAAYATGDITIEGQSIASGDVSGSGQVVTIITPITLSAPLTVNVIFTAAADIQNPTIAGKYKLKVWTEKETTPVESAEYTITSGPVDLYDEIMGFVESYATVTLALVDAEADYTIVVAAGTYPESLTIDESVTIEGAGALTTDIVGGHTVTASDVTITGFDLSAASGVIITIDSTGDPISGFAVTDCIFDMTAGAAVGITVGTAALSEKVSDVTISDNTFNGPTSMNANPWRIGAWYGAPRDAVVENLTFQGNTVNKCSIPINLDDGDITNIVIDGNTFAGTDGAVYFWAAGAAEPEGVVSGFEFTNNDLSAANSYGVAFFEQVFDAGNVDLTKQAAFTDDNFGLGNFIHRNDFSGITGAYALLAVSFLGDFTAYEMDATCNWWGLDTGPVLLTDVSGDVLFAPWCVKVTLDKGWNLMSSTVIPSDTAIETVLAGMDDVISVWHWDTTGWLTYVPGGPSDLATMEDGKAYWINMAEAADLFICGSELAVPPALPPAYDVVVGWNMVGHKSITNTVASTYLAGNTWVRIYKYDGGWAVVLDAANMEPGLGYWVAFTAAGTIYP